MICINGFGSILDRATFKQKSQLMAQARNQNLRKRQEGTVNRKR